MSVLQTKDLSKQYRLGNHTVDACPGFSWRSNKENSLR
jgi:hypothetical protein